MSSPPPQKRQRAAATKEVSPPPLKRKRLEAATISVPPRPQIVSNLRSVGESNDDIMVLSESRKTGLFRIVSWNVNGIEHLLPKNLDQKSIKHFFRTHSPQGGSDLDPSSPNDGNRNPIRQFLRRRGWPEVVGLQEVKIPSSGPAGERLMEAMRKAINSPLPDEVIPESSESQRRYEAFFSLPRDKFNARGLGGKGKVYGVCTLIRCDILTQSETKDVEWDLEGRVLATALSLGSGKEKVVVMNGYWPNGTLNPWRDSSTGEVAGTRHEFKRLFHSRMLGEVKKWEGQGYAVVLVGDMNVAPEEIDGYPGIRKGVEHVKNRKDFNWKFLDKDNQSGMKGVDSWRWCRGMERGFSYHGEKEEDWGISCDRVDLGVVSRCLVDSETTRSVRLKGAEIWESVEDRGPSDHVPIEVILEFDLVAENRTLDNETKS